jgi:hypothetical protein
MCVRSQILLNKIKTFHGYKYGGKHSIQIYIFRYMPATKQYVGEKVRLFSDYIYGNIFLLGTRILTTEVHFTRGQKLKFCFHYSGYIQRLYQPLSLCSVEQTVDCRWWNCNEWCGRKYLQYISNYYPVIGIAGVGKNAKILTGVYSVSR